jgi:DNA polymerase-3 subunit gamma/tau
MVFYLKYRPQTIEELDSKAVRDALTSVLSGKSVPHAFLFTGPKGLGKTSTARIVAKAVNCEQLAGGMSHVAHSKKGISTSYAPQATSQIEPCNKCYQCTSITNGTNIDVLEIDGASNRGIDEIRDLREKVRLAPASALRKVYIIDEVHMLTTEAFNALLKTLEEPPEHVIFILCTTEPHKVPATIVSRCLHITFKKATIEELIRSFKRITGIEKLKIDDEALSFIATLSDGSFRDGVKILEEMAAYGKTISKELVEEKYQIRNLADQISEMLESLSKRDAKQGLQLVSKLNEQGVDIKYFMEQLISELHQMLLVEVGVNVSQKSEVRSLKLEIEDIKQLVEFLAKAHTGFKYAVLPQLPLELAIIEWQQAQESVTHLSSRPSMKGERRDLSHQSLGAGDSSTPIESGLGMTNKGNEQVWSELINKVKIYNHSIAGVLRGCSLKSYDKDKLIIEAGFKFHKERLEEEKTRAIIEKVCEEIAGKQISVSVVLKGGD